MSILLSPNIPNIAIKSLCEGKAKVVHIFITGGTVEVTTKTVPGNGPGPKPNGDSLKEVTPDHLHGLPSAEIDVETDGTPAGETIDDGKSLHNDEVALPNESPGTHENKSESAPKRNTENIGKVAENPEPLVKEHFIFVTKAVKFKAPTFAPFGINREPDLVKATCDVGVEFTTPATNN